MTSIELKVNGKAVRADVTPRTHLADFLREQLVLTGTHIGCEHGICGACTVLVDGKSARACMMLAVQADGTAVRTVESLAAPDGTLHPIQQAFWDNHGLQCGFCTPGMLIAAYELLQRNAHPTETQVREAISGNVCRCTGYVNIVKSVLAAASVMAGEGAR